MNVGGGCEDSVRVLAPSLWELKSITLDGEDITGRPLDVTGRVSVSGLRVTLTDKVTTSPVKWSR